jgi:hypothetical protein
MKKGEFCNGMFKCSLKGPNCNHTDTCPSQDGSLVMAAGQWSGEVLSSFTRTSLQFVDWGMSPAIVDAAAGSGGSRMTSSARIV